jgi:hypothetical protein
LMVKLLGGELGYVGARLAGRGLGDGHLNSTMPT